MRKYDEHEEQLEKVAVGIDEEIRRDQVFHVISQERFPGL